MALLVRTRLSLYLFPSRLLSPPITSLLCPFLTLITAHGRPRQGIGKYFQFTWPTALREGNLENTPSKVVFTTHLKGLGIPPLAYLLLNCENHKNGLGCFPREAKDRRVGRMLETVHCVRTPSSSLHIRISASALTSHGTKTREQFIKDWYYINLENQLFVSFCCCFISKHIENSHASQIFFLSFRWEHSFNKYLTNTYVFYIRHSSRCCRVYKDTQEETLTSLKVQICLKELNIFNRKR